MRIVQMLSDMDPGEVSRCALDFAGELVRQGHESIVISNGGELVSRLTLRGSRHILMPLHKESLWSLRLVGRLRRLLAELQADIVHAHAPVPAWLARRALRKMPEDNHPRLVTGAHGFHARGFYGGNLACGERVIAVSQCVAEHLQKYCGKKLHGPPQVIQRGVNTREFDRNAPVSGQWQLRLLNNNPQLEGKHWLLMPAPLAPGMGQGVFLQMLAALARQRQDVFGLIIGASQAGEEKYARKLEKLALNLGLSDKVMFLGERRDMRELYGSSQITYNLAECTQPYCATAGEALAMGCPVVAYKGGSAGEVLQQCFPQGLVDQGNLDAMVETSVQILERPQSIHFHDLSHEDTAARTLALYRELCGAC